MPITTADLFAQIRATPEDDTLRLVYADMLDDEGDHLRAEFIRVQVELSRMPPRHVCKEPVSLNSEGQGYYTTANYGMPEIGQRVDVTPYLGMGRKGKVKHGLLVKKVIDDGYNVVLKQDKDSVPWPGKSLRRREQELITNYAHQWGINWFLLFGDNWREHVTYSRGFVSTVRLPLQVWIGEECDKCVGDGWYWSDADLEPIRRQCHICHGLGRIHAHGPALVRAVPLERVEVSDRSPVCTESDSVAWGNADTLIRTLPDVIPGFIWKLLTGGSSTSCWRGYQGCLYREQAIAKANDALSDALLTWANSCPIPSVD